MVSFLAQQLEQMGYTYFDWNVDSKDAGGAKTPDEVYQNVVGGISTRRTSVVLMHDIHWFTVDAVERIIPELQARGYQIVTVRELLYHHDVEIVNGTVYHSSFN